MKSKWYLKNNRQISCHRSDASTLVGDLGRDLHSRQYLLPRLNFTHSTYLLAGGLLEHAAQLVGDLLVLRSVLAGVHGVAGL